MDADLITILGGAFAAGFTALNLRGSDRDRSILVGLALAGPALMLLGVPRLHAPWTTLAAIAYSASALSAAAWTLRSAWRAEPRRMAFAAGQAAAALAVMIAILSFA